MMDRAGNSASLRAGLCVLLLFVSACSDDNPATPLLPPPDEIETDLTDPSAVIASHAEALTKKDFIAYEALLDDSFEFYPLERDAEDFPWLEGSSWSIVAELTIIGHMFDPNFVGEETAVHAIDAELTVLTQQPLDGGRTELTCTMRGQVLTAANDGWRFDTRMLFELVPRDGYLRILKMTEVEAVRGSASVEAESWGNLKNLYR